MKKTIILTLALILIEKQKMNNVKRYVLPIGVSSIILLFLILTFINVQYRARSNAVVRTADNVAMLQKIFQRIYQTCIIIDFDYQKNPINFLNTKEFTGSEVGPMNLVHPDKWEGPYLEDNPTMQTIEYQIVHTKNGYFITPGEGVELPNDKVIGKDIILDEDADIFAMMDDTDKLMSKRRVFAAPLIGIWPAKMNFKKRKKVGTKNEQF